MRKTKEQLEISLSKWILYGILVTFAMIFWLAMMIVAGSQTKHTQNLLEECRENHPPVWTFKTRCKWDDGSGEFRVEFEKDFQDQDTMVLFRDDVFPKMMKENAEVDCEVIK